MGRKGLTLMELLTVISILATLAALLYPVYLKVRSRNYLVSCANQLRQIGLAAKMYVNDLGDDMPYSMGNIVYLHPIYISEKDLLVCPYFRIIAPEVVEEMHHLLQQKFGLVWSSYFSVCPSFWLKPRRRVIVTFPEVYALRGDQVPIVFCNTHREGCPFSNIPYFLSPKGKNLRCDHLYDPSQPLLVLRWSGSVNAVYKPLFGVGTDVLLLGY